MISYLCPVLSVKKMKVFASVCRMLFPHQLPLWQYFQLRAPLPPSVTAEKRNESTLKKFSIYFWIWMALTMSFYLFNFVNDNNREKLQNGEKLIPFKKSFPNYFSILLLMYSISTFLNLFFSSVSNNKGTHLFNYSIEKKWLYWLYIILLAHPLNNNLIQHVYLSFYLYYL